MPNSALPDNLKGKKHTDWPKPFRWIPRGWTAFKWGKPKLWHGKATADESPDMAPKPINPPGTWQIAYFPDAPWWAKPFAWFVGYSGKMKGGKFRNYRVGARWDDVDDYTNCTFLPLPSSRKYTGDPVQDTST